MFAIHVAFADCSDAFEVNLDVSQPSGPPCCCVLSDPQFAVPIIADVNAKDRLMMYLLLKCQLWLKDPGQMSGGRYKQYAISIIWKCLHGN